MPNIQVLRVGKISSINYHNSTARVIYEDRDGATTGELPFLAWEYWMPRVADVQRFLQLQHCHDFHFESFLPVCPIGQATHINRTRLEYSRFSCRRLWLWRFLQLFPLLL